MNDREAAQHWNANAEMPLSQPHDSVRAVFFDAGFTLLYVEEEIELCFARFCRRNGFEVPLETLREGYRRFVQDGCEHFVKHEALYGADPAAYWRRANGAMLRDFGMSPAQAERLADLVFDELHLDWRTFPDVHPTLQTLAKAGVKLGVISNWGPDLVETLESAGVRDYFDAVISSWDLRAMKPASRLFAAALEQTGVAPNEAVHVGDNLVSDVEGAARAGITPVLLDRKQAHSDATCLRIGTLSELTAIIHPS
jgi:putative hydrolase of the HAD superfamily